MKTEPERAYFERTVVEPIDTGFLVTISTDSEDKISAFKSYRQVLAHLKTANKVEE